jgi:puromycin-sensitive aminopeptidase
VSDIDIFKQFKMLSFCTFSSGLANFSSKALLSKALDFSLSKDVRSQDTVQFIAAIARNPLGRDLAWDFFKQNFELFKNRYYFKC